MKTLGFLALALAAATWGATLGSSQSVEQPPDTKPSGAIIVEGEEPMRTQTPAVGRAGRPESPVESGSATDAIVRQRSESSGGATLMPRAELLDKTVYADGGARRVGRIVDVVETGPHERLAIVDLGRRMSLGGKRVALPLDQLELDTAGRLMTSASPQGLHALPPYSPER